MTMQRLRELAAHTNSTRRAGRASGTHDGDAGKADPGPRLLSGILTELPFETTKRRTHLARPRQPAEPQLTRSG
jgi:hypothetical protein